MAQPLSVLSQYNENPGEAHWNAALRLLAYVRETSKVGLQYSGGDGTTEPQLVGVCDASYACHEDATSQGGYFFSICGAAVSWRSY